MTKLSPVPTLSWDLMHARSHYTFTREDLGKEVGCEVLDNGWRQCQMVFLFLSLTGKINFKLSLKPVFHTKSCFAIVLWLNVFSPCQKIEMKIQVLIAKVTISFPIKAAIDTWIRTHGDHNVVVTHCCAEAGESIYDVRPGASEDSRHLMEFFFSSDS